MLGLQTLFVAWFSRGFSVVVSPYVASVAT